MSTDAQPVSERSTDPVGSSDGIAISVQNLSKCFEMYDRPVYRLYQTLLAGRKKFYKEFWALRGINFEIKKGECIGIIGRNGAGKSTLLQIISGTMQPTSGHVEVKGRIAALLELGSGFNQEFTGRDNVRMNATILGLSPEEIERKYEQIVEFADIGEFIHQPAKTYSSGMLMRLAFAVQAMVEPDILVIDEALAVGDARFQLKCFRRLDELRQRGTTILFVSHAVDQIKSMCSKALLLDQGRQVIFSDAKSACHEFNNILFPQLVENQEKLTSDMDGAGAPAVAVIDSAYVMEFLPEQMNVKKWGAGGARMDRISFIGLAPPNLLLHGKLRINCEYSWDRQIVEDIVRAHGHEHDISVGVALANKKGEYLFGCNGYDAQVPVDFKIGSSATVEFEIEIPKLNRGEYFVTFAISIGSNPHHTQLMWYDYAVQLVSAPDPGINFYGIYAANYSMRRLIGKSYRE